MGESFRPIDLTRSLGTGLLPGRSVMGTAFNCGTCRMLNRGAMMSFNPRAFTLDQSGQILSLSMVKGRDIFSYIPSYYAREESICPDYILKPQDMARIRQIAQGRKFTVRDNRVLFFDGESRPERLLSWYVPHEQSVEAFNNTVVWWNNHGLIRSLTADARNAQAYYRTLQAGLAMDQCNRVEIDYSYMPTEIEYAGPAGLVNPGLFGGQLIDSRIVVPGSHKVIRDYYPNGSMIRTEVVDEESARTDRTFTVRSDRVAVALSNLAQSYDIDRLEISPNENTTDIHVRIVVPEVVSTFNPSDASGLPHCLRVEESYMPTNYITEDMASTLDGLAKGFETRYHPMPIMIDENGNRRIDDVAQGFGPNSFSDLAGQHNRWALGGMHVFLSKARDIVKSPSMLLSKHFLAADQAWRWYQHGLTDTLLTFAPAVYWGGSLSDAGVVSLITGLVYGVVFISYLSSTLATYFQSCKSAGMSLQDVIDKEAMIKIMAPTYHGATLASYKVGLKRGIDPGFIVTETGAKTERQREAREVIVGNAWRLALNTAATSIGMAFMINAGIHESHTTSYLEWSCYAFNTFFPAIDGLLRLHGINRNLASFDDFGVVAHAFDRPGRYEIRAAITDACGNTVRHSREVDIRTSDSVNIALDPGWNLAELSGGPYTIEWNFEDGSNPVITRPQVTSGSINFAKDIWFHLAGNRLDNGLVSHRFPAPGKYAITATIIDASGQTVSNIIDGPVKNSDLYIRSDSPVDFSINSKWRNAWDFSGLGQGPYTIKWDFGDNKPIVAEMRRLNLGDGTVQHRFATPGEYTVTATIRDASGNAVSETREYSINRTDDVHICPNIDEATHWIDGSRSSTLGGLRLGPYTIEWDFGDGSAPVIVALERTKIK